MTDKLVTKLTADATATKQIDRVAGILGIDHGEVVARAIAAYLFLVESEIRGHEIAIVKNNRSTIAYVDMKLPRDADAAGGAGEGEGA